MLVRHKISSNLVIPELIYILAKKHLTIHVRNLRNNLIR